MFLASLCEVGVGQVSSIPRHDWLSQDPQHAMDGCSFWCSFLGIWEGGADTPVTEVLLPQGSVQWETVLCTDILMSK
jgi:hypothetical protein